MALCAVALLSSSFGCGSSGGGNNYGKAVAGAAILLTSVAVLRAATGECWARCDKGRVCDHDSGLCIEGECYPACGWGQHCEHLSTGLACVPDPNAGITSGPAPAAPPPAPSAPASATSAEPPSGASSGEPASEEAPAEPPSDEPPEDTWFVGPPTEKPPPATAPVDW